MATFPQITSPPQASAEVITNQNFGVLEPLACYAMAYLTTSGLTWGYYGGRWGGFSVADGTLTLTDASANYIVVKLSDGVISAATASTNWDNTTDYKRVYKVTCAGGVVSAVEDHRAGPGGVHGGGGAPGGGAVVDVDAAIRSEAQAAQSNRYLMRDGMFRDPLTRGTGVLTVGSIATVTNDTKYNSWPQICRLRGGKLLLAYAKGDSHNLDNTGRSVGKIGTENVDGTITWGSEIEIYDHPSLVSVPYGISQVSSGRIFASIQQYYYSGGTMSAGVVYSDDDGATWSAFVDFTADTGLTGGAIATGPVVELRNGDLLCLAEGIMSGGTIANRSSVLVRSTDGGLTWGDPVTVRAYATDTRPYYESMLALLDDDSLLVLHRCSTGASTHYAQKSTDGGATWGTPYTVFSGWGAPRFIQASTGTLIAITRRNSGAAVIAFTSADRGLTWDAGTTLDATMYEMEYGCPVELTDGRVLVAYGFQALSPYTDCDIKVVPITEGKWALDRRAVTAIASASGVVTADCGKGDYFTLALTENVTSLAFTNPPGAGRGATLMLRITQDSTARTVAWPASFKWAGGTAGAVSTGSGAIDLLALTTFDNGATWRATLAQAWA